MADRKVLVKYYPPDFDPEKLAQKGRFFAQPYGGGNKRRRTGEGKLMNVRFMFPFTMCCGMCNEFIYIGTKFNSRVKKIKGEEYLGIPIWRFFARCPHCRAEIAFKTDPKNTEYILESGGTRTYDPRKDAELAESTLKEQLEKEISTDTMKALEHKTCNTASELEGLEQLDELRKINKRLLSREATLDHAIEWLKNGGLDKPSKQQQNDETTINFDSEMDELELEEFRIAKNELDGQKLDKLLTIVQNEEEKNKQTSATAHDDALHHTSEVNQATTKTTTPLTITKNTSNQLPYATAVLIKKKINNKNNSINGVRNLIQYDEND